MKKFNPESLDFNGMPNNEKEKMREKISSLIYKVSPKDKIQVHKIDSEEGKNITEEKVLLISDKDVQIGTPLLKNITVNATVRKHARQKKVITGKQKAKKRYFFSLWRLLNIVAPHPHWFPDFVV